MVRDRQYEVTQMMDDLDPKKCTIENEAWQRVKRELETVAAIKATRADDLPPGVEAELPDWLIERYETLSRVDALREAYADWTAARAPLRRVVA